VSAASLPYVVLIMLVELATGSLIVVTLFDARRMVTAGYVKTGALTVLPLAAMALATALSVARADEVDGYALASDWFRPLRESLVAFTAACAAYLVATMIEQRRASIGLGVVSSVLGAVVLVTIAGLVAPPTWSYFGAVASLLAGALVLGGALMAMTWGHWYLTNSGLPKEPLEQMSLLVLSAVAVQTVLVVLAAIAPVREVPLSDGLGVSLGANPAFWLRVAVGLAFPMFLAWLAWKAAAIRGMMSATGLLYIALGAVLAGELLGRGLMFATGALV